MVWPTSFTWNLIKYIQVSIFRISGWPQYFETGLGINYFSAKIARNWLIQAKWEPANTSWLSNLLLSLCLSLLLVLHKLDCCSNKLFAMVRVVHVREAVLKLA